MSNTQKIPQDKLNEAVKTLNKKARDMKHGALKSAATKGQKKIADLSAKIPTVMAEVWEDLKLMVLLLKDYVSGAYREIPWNSVVAVAAAMIYFVIPIDSIPDFIPALGLLDDATVIGLVLKMVREDLNRYNIWRKTVVTIKPENGESDQ